MRAFLLPCLAFITNLFTSVIAQNASDINSDVNKLVNRSVSASIGGNNVYMNQILGREIAKRSDPVLVKEQLKSLTNADDQKKLFTTISTDAQKRMEAHQVGASIIRLNGEIIKGSTSYVPVLGKITEYSMDNLNDYLIDQGLNSVKRHLKSQLDTYRATKGQQQYDNLIRSYDASAPAAFLDNLEKGVAPIAKDYLKDVPPEEQEIVTRFYVQQATTVLKGGIQAIAAQQKVQAGELKTVQQDIKGISRAFYQHIERNQQQMNQVIAIQKEIQNDLGQFKQETNRNFEFVFDFMYSRMSVQERVAAIEQGFVGRQWSPVQLQEEKAKLAVLAKQERIQQTVNQMLDAGNNLLNIAKNLGVSSKILGPASQIVQAGSIVNSAYKAFCSGNYLGAISAVTDLFGLGGPDPAVQRHEQIMQSFERVFGQLDAMDAKLNALLDGQQKILQTQMQIYQAVSDLSVEVSKNHLEVMDKLREIQGDILINRRLIISPVMSKYASCEYITPVLSKDESTIVFQTDSGWIPSLQSFNEMWLNKNANCKSCAERFETVYEIINGQRELSSVFQTETYLTDQTRPAWNDVKTGFDLSLRFLYSSLGDSIGISLGERQRYLFNPVSDWQSWELKKVKGPEQEYGNIKNYLLEPNIIGLHTRYLLNFHLYFMLVNPSNNNNPYTYPELISAPAVITTGESKLKECLILVDHAIAQQNLVSGDVLIPILSKAIHQRDSTNKAKEELFQDAMKLLSLNSLLARNFLIYQFRETLKLKGDPSYVAYALAATEANKFGDFKGIMHLSSFPWRYTFSQDTVKNEDGRIIQAKGASIQFGSKFYSIPNYTELVAGNVRHTADFSELLLLREKLLREISTYSVYKGLTPSQQKALNLTLLKAD